MELEGIILNEKKQTEQDKYCTYMWNLKQKQQKRKENIEKENRLWMPREEDVRGSWRKVVKRYKLPVIK